MQVITEAEMTYRSWSDSSWVGKSERAREAQKPRVTNQQKVSSHHIKIRLAPLINKNQPNTFQHYLSIHSTVNIKIS